MSCKGCKHFRFKGCMAFDSIPLAIVSGQIIHDKPIKGQKGDYVYTQGSNEVLEYEISRAEELRAKK